MEDNTNLNPTGGENTADDKKFTQEEVNNIVKNRLYKENEKLQNKVDELNQRALKADCKDFLRSESIQDYSIVDMIFCNYPVMFFQIQFVSTKLTCLTF